MLRRFVAVLLVALAAAVILAVLAGPALAAGIHQTVPGADFGEIGPVIAWAVGALVAFGPGARGITWIVDRVRDFLKIGDDPRYKVAWPLLALGVALVACLIFEVNTVGALFTALPRFTGSHALDGTAGQIVTAVALAGMASSWHDRDVAKNPPTPTA